MPSPFPGMNPYIEQDACWQDFHLEFLPAMRARLVAQVRPKYIVMLDEHIYVQEHAPGPRRLVGRTDISLAAPRPRAGEAAGVGILDPPVQVQIPVQDDHRVPFLEIRDRQGRDLITVVELLSPANKRGGADREQYMAKREELLKSAAHFVEIDLLRRGRPTRSPAATERIGPIRRSVMEGVQLRISGLIPVASFPRLPGTTPAACRSPGRSARAYWSGDRGPCRSPAG